MAEINWSTDELRGLSTALGNHIAQTRKNAQDPDPRLAEQWNDELNSALYLGQAGTRATGIHRGGLRRNRGDTAGGLCPRLGSGIAQFKLDKHSYSGYTRSMLHHDIPSSRARQFYINGIGESSGRIRKGDLFHQDGDEFYGVVVQVDHTTAGIIGTMLITAVEVSKRDFFLLRADSSRAEYHGTKPVDVKAMGC